MRTAFIALTLVSLAFAGCLGKDAPVETAAVPDEGSPTSDKATPSPAPASPTPTPASATPAEDADESSAESAPVVREVSTPVAFEGSLDTGACVPAGPNTCMGPAILGGDDWVHFEVPGLATGADLTLTWTSTSPLDAELRFILIDATGDESEWSGDSVAEASGPSPLALSASGLSVPADHMLIVMVRQVRLTPEPVYGFVTTGTEFKVEGTVASQVQEAAP